MLSVLTSWSALDKLVNAEEVEEVEEVEQVEEEERVEETVDEE
jgi:hypothetical protein